MLSHCYPGGTWALVHAHCHTGRLVFGSSEVPEQELGHGFMHKDSLCSALK